MWIVSINVKLSMLVYIGDISVRREERNRIFCLVVRLYSSKLKILGLVKEYV